MGAGKLLRGHDASASLRHPQMAPGFIVHLQGQLRFSFPVATVSPAKWMSG